MSEYSPACVHVTPTGARLAVMQVQAWLERAAQRRPDAVALEDAEGTLTYAALHARASAVAREFRARGAGPGERVALALPAGRAFAEVLHACLLLGAVAVPVDLRLGAQERAVRTAGCAVVVDGPLAGEEG